jgi:hypothetical protein
MGILTRNALVAVTAVLAVMLGPHMFLMLALTVTLSAVVVLAWRIDLLTMATGWGIVPCRRAAA